MGLDCDPQSIANKVNTIMRNGPKDIVDKIIRMTSVGAITVIGGGGHGYRVKKV